jgi:hypothetical protein
MREIPLTQGLMALVDDEDYHWLSRFNWCAHEGAYGYIYAISGNLRMHRLVLGISTNNIAVDHTNRNTLDNRKSNLRRATASQNQQNATIRVDNTSGYKGVSMRYGRYISRISVEGKRLWLGEFSNPEDAARAYDKAALEYFGEFARTNFSAGR